MALKTWLKSKPKWLSYGIVASGVYSLILILLYATTFIPLPQIIGFILDRVYEFLFFPQMFIASQILLKTLIYNSYRSWNILFYFIQFVLTIILGFIIGAVIGALSQKKK